MKSTNPRDVAYMFRDFARQLHQKAAPSDPYFVKISVTCGKVMLLLQAWEGTSKADLCIADRTMVRASLPFLRRFAQHAWRAK
jgi:hypothetical protein